MCAEVLGTGWYEVDVARTALGKPYLRSVGDAGGARARRPDLPCFNFNVSHHGAFVALASEPGCAVGLDVMNEAERPPRALGAGTDEYFSSFVAQFAPAEWDAIHARGGGGDAREAARFSRFYRFWALKESYIKAHGEGLGHALDRLVFRIDDADAGGRPSALPLDAVVEVDGAAPRPAWSFRIARIDADHFGCVARAAGPAGCSAATLDCPRPARHAAALEAPHPPWTVVDVRDLLPDDARQVVDAARDREEEQREQFLRRVDESSVVGHGARN